MDNHSEPIPLEEDVVDIPVYVADMIEHEIDRPSQPASFFLPVSFTVLGMPRRSHRQGDPLFYHLKIASRNSHTTVIDSRVDRVVNG